MRMNPKPTARLPDGTYLQYPDSIFQRKLLLDDSVSYKKNYQKLFKMDPKFRMQPLILLSNVFRSDDISIYPYRDKFCRTIS